MNLNIDQWKKDIDYWVDITKRLQYELELARASSSYWREKYIAARDAALYLPDLTNATSWFRKIYRAGDTYRE